MTTIRTMTTEAVLGDSNPAKLPVALSSAKANLAAVLAALGTRVTETKACNASFEFQLSKVPLPGSIVMARKTGSYLTQAEVHPLCTLTQGQFKVDYGTRVVTAEGTDFNESDEAVFIYTGLTADSTGAAGTALAEALADAFED